jgi:hypothetical protein
MTVLQVHWQPGEVGIPSSPYHLMHGRHGTGNFNGRNRWRAFENLLEQARCADAERERQPAAAPQNVADDGQIGLSARSGLLKENRLGISVEARTDLDEIDLLGDGLQFAFVA